jgi:hypothetical protein
LQMAHCESSTQQHEACRTGQLTRLQCGRFACHSDQ